MFPGFHLYHVDPAQPLTTVGEELDDLYHDLSVRGVKVSSLTRVRFSWWAGGPIPVPPLYGVCAILMNMKAGKAGTGGEKGRLLPVITAAAVLQTAAEGKTFTHSSTDHDLQYCRSPIPT